ncbi:MAG: protein-disulfide reductase DsbD domain-containing protein [Paracoccaceae bacterium]
MFNPVSIFRPMRTALTLAALALSPLAAVAQENLLLEDVYEVTVMPGWRTENGTNMAAIRIELAPGWKTYWRSPGEIGIPPRFAWSGSRNLGKVEIFWPTPSIHYTNGLRSIGYSGTTVIPIELTPKSAAKGATLLRGEMELGICDQICIPTLVKLSADLPLGGSPDPEILASLADRPATAAEAGVRSVSCEVEPISDGLRITARISLPKMGPEEATMFELPDQSIWIGESTTTRRGRKLTAVADFVPPNAAPFLLSRSDVRITVVGERGAVDIQGCAAP